eukprot:3913378-Pleurochrysis_carterae.AAC.3
MREMKTARKKSLVTNVQWRRLISASTRTRAASMSHVLVGRAWRMVCVEECAARHADVGTAYGVASRDFIDASKNQSSATTQLRLIMK